MFMDPSAFEAEDIEKELADAGIKPEMRTPAGFHHGDGTENLPSSGSSYGLGPRAAHGNGGGSGGDGGGSGGGSVGSGGGSMLHPRAMGKDRGHQAAPTYGRHSIGTAGRRSGDRSGDRSQFSASSPSIPLGNGSPPEGPPSAFSRRGHAKPESHSFGYEGNVSAGREDEKLEGDAPERESFTGPSSATGIRSRARVLAQQREIQRKRRQQALNAGGIRASDAASLSRGIIFGNPRIPQQHPSEDDVASGGRSAAPGPGTLGDADEGEGRDPADEGEEGYSFSPSVKQFSAPRQVEGGAYTAFNSNPRHAGERLSGMSEFEHRPSSGNGVLGDSDEDDHGGSFGGGGGGSLRRGKKLVPEMGDRSGNDVEGSSESLPPGSKDKRSEDSNTKNRPDDWDDRHRPSTKSFQWGRGSGGEGSEGGINSNTDGNNNTWRSVGRDSSSITAKTSEKKHTQERERPERSPSSSPEAFIGERYPYRSSRRSHSRSGSKSRSSSSHHEESDDDSVGDHVRDGRRRSQRHSDKARTRSGRSRAGHDGTKLSRRYPSETMNGEERSGRAGEGSRRARGRRAADDDSGSSVNEERNAGVNGSDNSDGGDGRRRERRHKRDGSGGGGGSGSDRGGRTKRSGRGGGRGHQRRSSGRRHRSDSPVSDEGRRSDASDQRSEGIREGHGHATSRHHRRGGSGGGSNHRHHRSQRSNHHRRSGSDENWNDHGSNGGGTGRRHGRGRRDDDDDEHATGGGGKHRSRNSAGRSNGRSQEWVGRGSGSVSGRGKHNAGEGREEGKTKDGDENQASDGRGGNKSPQGGDDQYRAPPDGVTADPSTAKAATVGDEMEFNMDALDLSDMKKFLLSPCPRAAGVVQCYIRRNKTRANKLFPEYNLFMKEGDRFLMCSKKRPNNATSNYLVSMEAGDLDRNSRNFLGKLRANFVGTEFQVFDNGYNPREQTGTFGISKTLGGSGTLGGGWAGGGGGEQPMREELGCVMYASNVLGSRGPRKMQVAIPSVSEDSVVSKWSELDGGRGSQAGGGGSKAIERVKNRDYDGSLYMVNKPPRWNDQVGAYVLNFYGRVTMASVKNFQLVSTEDFDRIILQFGRVAKDEFTMDFQFPISPFQAFAITLSSFDSKIACD